MFQVDQTCSVESVSHKILTKDIQTEAIQLHCMCPGCKLYMLLSWIVVICTVCLCTALIGLRLWISAVHFHRSNRESSESSANSVTDMQDTVL